MTGTNAGPNLATLPEDLRALEIPDRSTDWTADDVLLYALAVGAGGVDPRAELNLTTENSLDVALQTLPTFAVILANGGPAVFAPLGLTGPDMLLLSESITMARPIPPGGGTAVAAARVVDVADHRHGYVVTSENRVTEGGSELFTTRTRSLVRVRRLEPAPPRGPRPDRPDPGEPAATVDFPIAANQCLLYRMIGGRNPLHSDPVVSAKAGYEIPLLHGRCTFGFAARHLITTWCGGDAARLGSIGGTFTAPVFPGDDLRFRTWGDASAGTYDVIRPSDGATVIAAGTYTCTG